MGDSRMWITYTKEYFGRVKVAASRLLPSSWVGWRTTSALYAIFTSLIFVGLTIPCLIWIAQDGFTSSHILFSGRCSKADKVNKVAHLVLTLLSTAVLLFSDSYLRLLSSPTRAEVNDAHRAKIIMDIGVLSARTLRQAPLLKAFLWVGFALTSIPLHLVFNAAVYLTETSTEYNQVLASEGFLASAPYSVPGVGYLSIYDWADDPAAQSVDGIAQSYVSNPSKWQKLETTECREDYLQPKDGLRSYRNLIVVVEIGPDSLPDGWTISQVWENGISTAYNTTELDGHNPTDMVPPTPENTVNSLWSYQSSCEVFNYLMQTSNLCDDQLGFHDYPFEDTAGLTFSSDEPWTFTWLDPGQVDSNLELYPNFNMSYNYVTAVYCMAEIFEVPCKVEVSNVLFCIVCAFILVKAILSVAVLRSMWCSAPLSTLGDAIESFLDNPDPTTKGLCSLSHSDFENYPKAFPLTTTSNIWTPLPRQWISTRKRLSNAIPRAQWIYAYSLILVVLLFSVVLLSMGASVQGGVFIGHTFGPSISNAQVHLAGGTTYVGLLSASMLANLPQLPVSLCYISINALLNRIFQAREWAQMSATYQPLHVTNPKGEQESTPLLQYPIMFALPLQGISIAIHWLVSQSLFMTVVEILDASPANPSTTTYGVRYSTEALFALLMSSFGVLLIPFLLGLLPIPSTSIVVGSSSAAISAACHRAFVTEPESSPAAGGLPDHGILLEPDSRDQIMLNQMSLAVVGDIPHQGYITHIHTILQVHDIKDPKKRIISGGRKIEAKTVRLAEQKLKWGVLKGSTTMMADRRERVVRHLGLGSENEGAEDAVGNVREGEWYAGF